MIKALALDIDGTLIERGSQTIYSSALKALLQCRRNGLKILIATGRCYCLVQDDVKNNLKPDGYVTINGAGIADSQGRLVDSYPLPAAVIPALKQRCVREGLALGLKYNEVVAVENDYEQYCRVYCKTSDVWAHVTDDAAGRYLQAHPSPLGAFIIGDNRKAESLAEEFTKVSFVHAYDLGTEVYADNLDKGIALAKALQTFGLSLDQCMAIGDSANDIAMLKACQIGVCMGNGDADAKQAADEIAPAIRQDGIQYILQKHGLLQHE